MIEFLESRRLYAASAVLNDGVLHIVGTGGADRIAVAASAISYPANDAGYGRVDAYVVTVNGKKLGSFAGDKVSKIKVFALGGNDRVRGVADAPTNQPRQPVKAATMYVEGGSGDDSITGSYGNDTLKGNDGNDEIADYVGRNWIEGNAGDDEIRVFGTRETILPDGSIMYVGFGGAKNLVLAGDGRDTVYSTKGDTLLDVPEDAGAYAI